MNNNNNLIQDTITQIVQSRRAVFPASYTDKIIPKELIELILENANHAPTHRLTEPWRFKVITQERLIDLGNLLARLYKENTNAASFSELKYNKTINKASKCSHIIAICMQRDPSISVPEWEEVAATAMAVQNMWLTAAAHGIGCYWSSPNSITTKDCHDFLNLKEGQRCLGFLYMGHHDLPAEPSKRNPIQDKVEWL